MHTLSLVAAALGFFSIVGFAHSLRRSDPPAPPTPQQAYTRLLKVRVFAFGPVGWAGSTSQGETAYRAIASGPNALPLFSAAFTNGNAQAKLYALCGFRQFAPKSFYSYVDVLRTANPEVETMNGCRRTREFATNAIDRICSGLYDIVETHSSDFKKP